MNHSYTFHTISEQLVDIQRPNSARKYVTIPGREDEKIAGECSSNITAVRKEGDRRYKIWAVKIVKWAEQSKCGTAALNWLTDITKMASTLLI